jgi:4-amino-4-deoxy-L-arabinose transferase-like glycosyltransferase
LDRRTLWCYALIVVSLAVRVAWAAWIAHAHPAAVTSPDTPTYIGPARALIHSGRFNLSPADSTPIFVRTPGYPAVLAAILWLTNSRWAISPIQAALSILTVVGTLVVVRRILGPAAGLVAALIVALDPLQFALSGTILTESLTSLMLVGVAAAGAVVFIRRPERVSMPWVAALGLLIAVATMFRPTMWFFPLVVLVLLAIHFRAVPPRALLTVLLVFALPIVAVVGGWQVRNHYAVHSWQVSGTAGIVMYCYNAAAVEAKVDGTSVPTARRKLGCAPNGFDLAVVCPSFWACDAKHPLADGHGFDEMSSRGVHILTRHPVQTAKVLVAGAAREIVGPGTDTVGRFLHVRSSHALAVPLFVWNLLLWSFALVGAVVGVRSRLRVFWIFVVSLAAYVIVVSAGAEAGARFRTPIVPLLAILAAYGIRAVVRARRTATLAACQ